MIKCKRQIKIRHEKLYAGLFAFLSLCSKMIENETDRRVRQNKAGIAEFVAVPGVKERMQNGRKTG